MSLFSVFFFSVTVARPAPPDAPIKVPDYSGRYHPYIHVFIFKVLKTVLYIKNKII